MTISQAVKDYFRTPENALAYYRQEVRAFNGTGKGHCSFHSDEQESFSVYDGFKWKCFAGCGNGDVIAFHQKKYGLDFRTAISELSERAGIKADKTYSLEDIKRMQPEKGYSFQRYHTYKEGNPPYIKPIYRNEQGGKTSRYFTLLSNGRYAWGRKSESVFYNQELLQQRPDDPVYIPEGESDCDTLTGLGLLAVTAGSASDKITPLMANLLKGRDVLIFMDEDITGKERGKRDAAILHGIAKSLKVIELPDLPEKKGADITDWLQAGGAKEKLIDIIRNTPEYELSSFPDVGGGQLDNPDFKPFPYLRKGSELGLLNITIEWAIDRLLPKQSITLLHGRGGIGKTWLSLILADAISRGTSFMGLATQKMECIFIDFENSLPVLVDRVRKANIEDVLFWHNSNEELKPPRLDNDTWEQYKNLPTGSLLIYDTLRASQGRDENDSQHMAFIMQRLKELRDMGFTVLLLHHTPKGNDRTHKGSTVILDLADHVLSLHKVKKANPEGGEVEDEEDHECLYRIGTKDKTRYEPFHIFMSFDKEKGFIKALDPDEEDLQAIYEILTDKGQLNQQQLFEVVKDELDLKSKGKLHHLLKKGEGKFWNSHREGRAYLYDVIGTVQLSDPYNAKTGQFKAHVQNSQTADNLNTPQTLDNSQLSNCPGVSQTVRTDEVIEVLEVIG